MRVTYIKKYLQYCSKMIDTVHCMLLNTRAMVKGFSLKELTDFIWRRWLFPGQVVHSCLCLVTLACPDVLIVSVYLRLSVCHQWDQSRFCTTVCHKFTTGTVPEVSLWGSLFWKQCQQRNPLGFHLFESAVYLHVDSRNDNLKTRWTCTSAYW